MPRLPVLSSPAAAAPVRRPRLQDALGRGIGYLRVSLTRACAMRCLYCRPAIDDQPAATELQPHEVQFLVSHLARHHGLKKVRLTGGDPTSRPDLTEILRRVASVEGIEDLAMTTHGLTLEHRAEAYARAGLKRVNVSLDTLDAARFAAITGVDALPKVLAGIEAARACGLAVKLNTVVVRRHNEDDLCGLVSHAFDRRLEIRFIELMPMGPLADRWKDRFVSEPQMRRSLEKTVRVWRPIEQGSDSARRYEAELLDGRTGTIGFITPMSCNFCAGCNRLRITGEGAIYPCLMDAPAGSVLPALRPKLEGAMLDLLLAEAFRSKQAEHPHDGHSVMTHLGG